MHPYTAGLSGGMDGQAEPFHPSHYNDVWEILVVFAVMYYIYWLE
jgi:hypothetical protein